MQEFGVSPLSRTYISRISSTSSAMWNDVGMFSSSIFWEMLSISCASSEVRPTSTYLAMARLIGISSRLPSRLIPRDIGCHALHLSGCFNSSSIVAHRDAVTSGNHGFSMLFFTPAIRWKVALSKGILGKTITLCLSLDQIIGHFIVQWCLV